jgi:hypothetical protein
MTAATPQTLRIDVFGNIGRALAERQRLRWGMVAPAVAPTYGLSAVRPTHRHDETA